MRYYAPKPRQARRDNRQKKRASFENSVVKLSCQHPIRIFIADSHEVFRAGVRALLEGERDLTVVGEADNAEDVFSESRRTQPDMVLLESGLSGSSESEICSALLNVHPSVRIISLMGDNNAAALRRAVEGGVQGYLRKSTCRIELVRAIHTVAKGGSYLSPENTNVALRLLRKPHDAGSSCSGLDGLSPQERRVIALIAEGNTNKEIATKLALSDKTVKNYIGNMFTKLEIQRRTQAVALYMKGQQHAHDSCCG